MTSTASVPTHAVAVPTFGKFFLPGPTDVHPEVLEAMIRPMVGHRSAAMEKLLQNVAPKLGAVARTSRPVFVGTNSATGFMEMAVRNGVRRRGRTRHAARRVEAHARGRRHVRPLRDVHRRSARCRRLRRGPPGIR